jgi:hypothetical protein
MKLIQKYLKKKLQYKKKKFYKKKNTTKFIKYKKNLFLKPFKKKKKWKNWRQFKKFFLFKKRIYFFTKIKWRFNNIRILWHQLTKMYLPTIKKLTHKWKKNHNNKFFLFLKQLELRLSTIILRARFCYKLINAYNAIKLNLITVNGVLMNRVWYLLNILDLIQKRRTLKKKPQKSLQHKKKSSLRLKIKKQQLEIRTERFKWRKYQWNKSRYVLWKIRRVSHFNMYFSRKQNTVLNYLEINYKIPALIILKQPFLKELYINKQPKMLTKTILKKIYYLY